MKAMILAAGLGTRLKPLTDTTPKALIEVNGSPMLERVILNLRHQGFKEIVINVHHLASQIRDYLSSHDFGVDIEISDESEELLDTGGGIVKAKDLIFKKNDKPILIHNVDILSNSDLKGVIGELDNENFGAVLLVSERDSSRKLIFNEKMELVGWHDLKNNLYRWSVNKEKLNENNLKEYAFSGIYAMSKSGINEMKRLMGEGKYSVMDYFINSKREEIIKGTIQDNLKVIDIGKPATLLQASDLLIDSKKVFN